MSVLRQSVADYLSLRRSLGYSLQRPEKLLGQFIDYLDACGASTVTAEHALAWARLPESSDPSWWAHRLTVVRGFAGYLHALDEANEVPPTDVLVWKSHRANPFIYADDEITALIAAAATLSSPLRVVTYQTLIGLLATTGMRIGEAIDLDVDDFDADNGILLVRRGKGGATRQLPLHPSTTTAVHRYLHHPARQAGPRNGALLISPAGTRLLYCNVQWTFQKLLRHIGIQPRSRTCRSRIHDLRHTFAVTALLDAYRDGLDIDRRLTLRHLPRPHQPRRHLLVPVGHTAAAGRGPRPTRPQPE